MHAYPVTLLGDITVDHGTVNTVNREFVAFIF